MKKNIIEGAEDDLRNFAHLYKVVDKIIINDYTMYLFEFSLGNTPVYQIGMTYKDDSFMFPPQQAKKEQKRSTREVLEVKKGFIKKLKEWVSLKKGIFFGSYNHKKADTYYSILNKLGYNLSEPQIQMSAKVFQILS